MKKIITICGLAVCTALVAGCAGTGVPVQKAAGVAGEFFNNYLQGEALACTDSSAVTDVEKTAGAVWEAWTAANAALEEQQLPRLQPLEKAQGGAWMLPEELEPMATMPYLWGSKGDVRPQEGWPLFIYTHGSGPKEYEWRTGCRICSRFEDAPSAYFIPQIPNEGNYYRWWHKSKQWAWEKLLRQALAGGEIDPYRVYVFGISEGGYGSQRLASFYADYLAGAGPMAGGEPLKNAPAENCGNIAFSLLTGAEDRGFYRNILTGYVQEAFDSLQRQYPDRYAHRIELIPGKGHHIDYKPTTPWLSRYRRNPWPKSFIWENMEMDGRYRDGFYNLAVRGRSNADFSQRTVYRMDIRDNRICLDVSLVSYKAVEVDPNWGIELRFEKGYVPAEHGKVTVYLNRELVDMDREVVLELNGKEVYRGLPRQELRHLANSCALFGDPLRLFPAALEVDW